jgi:SAM-dependent methyltransferase
MDPKRLVAEGYDRLHLAYARWGGGHAGLRRRYIDRAIELGLEPPARALDLGCGTGQHATAYLVERGFEVTGVDSSRRSIEAARAALPRARFLIGDMTSMVFPRSSFDLVTAFYSIIHVPRSEHAQLLARIAGWLRPGGLLVASLGGGHGQPAGHDGSWLGLAPMYWSFWDPATSLGLIQKAGLDLVEDEDEVMIEDDQKVMFWWVIARKAISPDPAG